jgi:DNA polymerase-1
MSSITATPDWDDENFVAADVETSGTKREYALQPWRYATGDFWLTSIAWVWREQNETKSGGTLFPDYLQIKEFLAWVIQTRRIVVGWNLVFDISVLIAMGFREEAFQIRWLDGMLVWRHAWIEPEYDENRANKKSYALKPGAIKEFLPQLEGYDTDIDYHGTDPEQLQRLHDYNILDNYATLRITKILYRKLGRKQRQSMWMETRCLPMVAEANVRGLLVDTIWSKELALQLEAKAAAEMAVLGKDGLTEEIARSPTKLAKLLFDDWKLPVLKETQTKDRTHPTSGKVTPGKTNRSTDKEVLYELAAWGEPRAKRIRTYRNALNGKAKFAERLVESAAYNGDGCTHPLARVFGTYTGRITVSSKQEAKITVLKHYKRKESVEVETRAELPIGFAQHQMMRGKEFRQQVIAPPGYDMVEFDAASQEYKWMAVLSKDPTMLSLCMPGENPHSYITAQIYNKDYRTIQKLYEAGDALADAERKMGKIGNLSCQYRTSAKRLRIAARVDYDVPMTQPEADLIHATYQRTYRGVPQYWISQISRCHAIGYAETLGGRRVQLVGDWNGEWAWRLQSTSINFPVQGTGADQKYLGMSILRDTLTEFDGHFLFDLHDGMYSVVPKDKSKAFAAKTKGLLDELPYGAMWGFVPPVPMDWDCSIGPNWGALKKFKP